MTDNTNRLLISPAVHAVITPDTAAKAIAIRETTEMKCPDCDRDIAPDSDELVTLVVFRYADTALRLRFAHASCTDPEVRDATAQVNPRKRAQSDSGEVEINTTFLPLLREDTPSAVLLVEPSGAVIVDGTNLFLEPYASAGFTGNPDGLRTTGPVLNSVNITLTGGSLRLSGLPGGVNWEYEASPDSLPPNFFDALGAAGQCLVVVGSLGLDLPNIERIDSLIKDGSALAAVLPATT